jgi:hypothetical protein
VDSRGGGLATLMDCVSLAIRVRLDKLQRRSLANSAKVMLGFEISSSCHKKEMKIEQRAAESDKRELMRVVERKINRSPLWTGAGYVSALSLTRE